MWIFFADIMITTCKRISIIFLPLIIVVSSRVLAETKIFAFVLGDSESISTCQLSAHYAGFTIYTIFGVRSWISSVFLLILHEKFRLANLTSFLHYIDPNECFYRLVVFIIPESLIIFLFWAIFIDFVDRLVWDCHLVRNRWVAVGLFSTKTSAAAASLSRPEEPH